MTAARQLTHPGEPPFDPEYDAAHADRVPRDDAAERYVLSAALADPTQIDICSRLLTASDFYQPRHEAIWRALLALHGADQPTEAPAVVAHLVDTGELARAGGHQYIVDLASPEQPVVPASAAHYAQRVDRLARRRRSVAEVRRVLQRLEAPGPDTDIDAALAETATALNEAHLSLANPATPTTWSPVDLEAVLAGEFLDPPPTMLMRADGVPLLYDGSIHTVAGESESGKTWLTLLATVQLVSQGERVVFLDFEDRADRVIGRLLALGATPDQIRTHFAYIRPDRPLDNDGRAQLAPHISGARLVIVDGVTEAMTMHGFDLNGNADAALFYGLLPRWIADHGPAVVMIDHVVKDQEKQGRFAIGAQHKLAGIDGVSYLVKMIAPFARGKRGVARVEIAKDRPGHVREHAHGRTIAEFTLDATASDVILIAHLLPPGETTGRTGESFEPTVLMEKISRYVQVNEGLSKKAVEDAVNGKASTKRLALELLVTRGYIGTKVEARGRISHFHMRPYYADPDHDPDRHDEAPEPTQEPDSNTSPPPPDPAAEPADDLWTEDPE